jgi:hypothetical protein
MTIYCPRCGKPSCDETVVSLVSVWASCTNCQLVWRSSLLETVIGYAARGVGLSRNHKVVDRYQPRTQMANPELQQPSESLKPISVDRVAEWLTSQERATGASRPSLVSHNAVDTAQVEEMFDMLDPVGPVKTRTITAQKEVDDFDTFFSDQDVQLPVAAAAHVRPREALSERSGGDDMWHLDEAEVAQPVQIAAQPVETVVQPVEIIVQPVEIVAHPVEIVVQQAPMPVVAAQQFVAMEPVQYVAEMRPVPHVDEIDEDVEASSDGALSNVEELYEAFKRLEQQLGSITDSLQTYNPHP